jgi:hypothetical protein
MKAQSGAGDLTSAYADQHFRQMFGHTCEAHEPCLLSVRIMDVETSSMQSSEIKHDMNDEISFFNFAHELYDDLVAMTLTHCNSRRFSSDLKRETTVGELPKTAYINARSQPKQ